MTCPEPAPTLAWCLGRSEKTIPDPRAVDRFSFVPLDCTESCRNYPGGHAHYSSTHLQRCHSPVFMQITCKSSLEGDCSQDFRSLPTMPTGPAGFLAALVLGTTMGTMGMTALVCVRFVSSDICHLAWGRMQVVWCIHGTILACASVAALLFMARVTQVGAVVRMHAFCVEWVWLHAQYASLPCGMAHGDPQLRNVVPISHLPTSANIPRL